MASPILHDFAGVYYVKESASGYAVLLAQESQQMTQMARRWLLIEDNLASQIDGLARDLAAEKAAV